MKSDDRILTRHPAGKQGVRIEKTKYALVRRALLQTVPRSRQGVPFSSLRELIGPRLLAASFPPEASVSWYMTVVKQDLEARGLIEQVAGSKPQRLRRCSAAQAGTGPGRESSS